MLLAIYEIKKAQKSSEAASQKMKQYESDINHAKEQLNEVTVELAKSKDSRLYSFSVIEELRLEVRELMAAKEMTEHLKKAIPKQEPKSIL